MTQMFFIFGAQLNWPAEYYSLLQYLKSSMNANNKVLSFQDSNSVCEYNSK